MGLPRSPGGALDSGPRRQPWVRRRRSKPAPEGRQNFWCDSLFRCYSFAPTGACRRKTLPSPGLRPGLESFAPLALYTNAENALAAAPGSPLSSSYGSPHTSSWPQDEFPSGRKQEDSSENSEQTERTEPAEGTESGGLPLGTGHVNPLARTQMASREQANCPGIHRRGYSFESLFFL